MKIIKSLQNHFIKDIIKLQSKSRERRKKELFLIEGQRELSLAIKSGYEIENILIEPSLFERKKTTKFEISENKIFEISKDVYKKIAYRDSTEGIVGIVKTKKIDLEFIDFKNKTPLILVLEGLEKPGNIGAILRTADAANVDAVLIANPKTDIFNPNIIRSSVGCVFTNQIGVGTSEEIYSFLQEKKINIYSATLQNSNEYYKNDYTGPSAIVLGTEASGLTNLWRNEYCRNINIPMYGKIDSMNVSVAAAILTFEAKRQRIF